ncbi:hypothetical protein RHMOL_Rhmol08G0040700 [Rhododendron molle]|uniref:Uncharacterized protein n=1 Tax=Rhododendron molle TaxID=49168 RepID=A0ACC0MJW8_RHOML|nr:hypothetical protein RHMOL_Rhmol08G0040700 [Rhododendron molle]
MDGVPLRTHPHYPARAQAVPEQNVIVADGKRVTGSAVVAFTTILLVNRELHSFWAAECVPLSDQIAVSGGKQTGVYPPPSYPSRSSATEPNLPVNLQFHRVATMAMILGKGNEVICKVAKLALFRRSSMSYAKFLQCCT